MKEGAGRKVGSRFFGMHRKNRRAPFVVLISTALAPANVFGKYVSICLGRRLRIRNKKTPAADSATGGILSAESLSNPPRPARSRFPIESYPSEKPSCDFRPLPAGARFQMFSSSRGQSRTSFGSDHSEARKRRKKLNRNGRSSDSFRPRRLPDL